MYSNKSKHTTNCVWYINAQRLTQLLTPNDMNENVICLCDAHDEWSKCTLLLRHIQCITSPELNTLCVYFSMLASTFISELWPFQFISRWHFRAQFCCFCCFIFCALIFALPIFGFRTTELKRWAKICLNCHSICNRFYWGSFRWNGLINGF